MLTPEQLKTFLSIAERHLPEKDIEFFRRVWSADVTTYENRLKAIGFTRLDNVLDAGCGFGQWAVTLARLNKNVSAIDISEGRIKVLDGITEHLNISNLTAAIGSIEKTGYANNQFDAVFSYSVLYFTNYTKTISEFARILKPGGKLYVCTNGLGWYLHNLINGHNTSVHFNSQQMAIETIENSLTFYATGNHEAGKQIITPKEMVVRCLTQNGFESICCADEGTIQATGESTNFTLKPFYKGEYFGKEGVYEILCYKKK